MSSDWVEAISEDGKKFYYHKVTRVSAWTIPTDSKPTSTTTPSSTTATPTTTTTASNEQPVIIGDWREYKTDKGQKYYYNVVTNARTWSAPPEFLQQPTAVTATPLSPTNTTIPLSAIASNIVTPVVAENKEDPIQIFKNLLTDNAISSICTFEKALKSISNDERYQVLKTMSERKQVFLDYQVDRKKVELEEKRKKEKKAKEDFIQLLRDSKEVTTLMSWRRASLYFESEPRWEAIESERERESLLLDYIQELEQSEKNQIISLKKEQMKLLRQKFEQDQSITVFTQWRKIRDQYDTEHNETVTTTTTTTTPILDKFDYLTVFENYIRDLEKRLDDQKRLEKEKLKKDSRKDRDNFRDLLNEKFKSGELHALTKWKQFKSTIEQHPSFINLASKSIGSTPLELFSDFKDDLEIKYENDYKKLKEILKSLSPNFKYIQDVTTLDSMKSDFSKHPNYNSISEFNFLPYLEYLKYKEESREKNLARKKKKKIIQFKILLTNTKSINKSSKWEDIQGQIETKKEYIGLDDEQERIKIFKDYIEYLVLNADSDDDVDGNEEGELILSPKKSGGDQNSKKRKPYVIDEEDDVDRYYSNDSYRDRDSRRDDRDSKRDDRDSRRDDRDRSSSSRSSYKKEKR